MTLNLFDDGENLAVREMISRLDPKFKPVWDGVDPDSQIALGKYFLPGKSSKSVVGPTRPRIIKWYCPFAAQATFPSGHRYCVNTYVGCAHGCSYCYANGYIPDAVNCKKDFEPGLRKDLDDLERFDVPAAPLHLSNSTDPFQDALETRFRHTRKLLEAIVPHRARFTTIIILTKNPVLAVRDNYIPLMLALSKDRDPGFVLEVSLAFAREEAAVAYDPGAPTVAARMAAIRTLSDAGVPLVLRIDPLFPPPLLLRDKSWADFGLVTPQTADDLEALVRFAASVNARHIVYSPLKIIVPRRRPMSDDMKRMKVLYEFLSKPVFRGGSYRLPPQLAQEHVVAPFLALCKSENVTAKFCMQNLIETR